MDIVRRKLILGTMRLQGLKKMYIYSSYSSLLTLLLSGELNNCSLIFFLFVIAVLF